MSARLAGTCALGALAVVVAAMVVGACSGEEGGGAPTLPPIVTTTTIAAPTTQNVFDQTRFYAVSSGDNLTRIAERFGVTVEALMAKNGITNPDSIAVGQILELPDGAVDATATTSTFPALGGTTP